MDTSFASVLSPQSLRTSLSAESYESGISLARNGHGPEGMQDSAARLSARERTIAPHGPWTLEQENGPSIEHRA